MAFTSVDKDDLRTAFALAHRASEDAGIPNRERLMFRAIAQLLWRAHGEQGAAPAKSGEVILDKMRDLRMATK